MRTPIIDRLVDDILEETSIGTDAYCTSIDALLVQLRDAANEVKESGRQDERTLGPVLRFIRNLEIFKAKIEEDTATIFSEYGADTAIKSLEERAGLLAWKLLYHPDDLREFSIGQTVETTESFTARKQGGGS